MEVHLISNNTARRFVFEHHYSQVMPRITKLCIGGFENDILVAVATLGYGVRPKHTIQKCFPGLSVGDYLEIGKLCVSDDMPRNSESQFIAKMIKLIRRANPELMLLYSWADGILGKPGYVYQASNFYFGGHIWTEMYLDAEGHRVHPRTMQGLSNGPRVGKFKTRRYETTRALGFTKYFGKQFRYVYPLCNKREWRDLMCQSPFTWQRGGYPKDGDCQWQMQVNKGSREPCGMPSFTRTIYYNLPGVEQLTLMER